MKKSIILISAVMLMAFAASAGSVEYSTTGVMSCGAALGCTLNPGDTSVTIGGITLTYDPVADTIVGTTPSLTGLGMLVTTGAGGDVSFVGVTLVINVDDISLGVTGDLPTGTLGGVPGTISTSSSSAIITFSPDNTVTTWGNLPGVALTSGYVTDTFQVYNATEGVEYPTYNATGGDTTLQGAVSEIVAPEPMTLGMLGFGLIGLGLLKRKRSVR